MVLYAFYSSRSSVDHDSAASSIPRDESDIVAMFDLANLAGMDSVNTEEHHNRMHSSSYLVYSFNLHFSNPIPTMKITDCAACDFKQFIKTWTQFKKSSSKAAQH